MKAPEENGFSLENMRKSGPAFECIDEFFVNHVKSKKDEFQMIIRGFTQAMKTAAPDGNVSYEKLRSKLSEMLIKILVGRNFKSEGSDERELFWE